MAAVDVVVVGHVALRPPRRIELQHAADEIAGGVETLGPARKFLPLSVAQHQFEQVIDAALLHDQLAVHVGFAQRQLRIAHQATLDLADR